MGITQAFFTWTAFQCDLSQGSLNFPIPSNMLHEPLLFSTCHVSMRLIHFKTFFMVNIQYFCNGSRHYCTNGYSGNAYMKSLSVNRNIRTHFMVLS